MRPQNVPRVSITVDAVFETGAPTATPSSAASVTTPATAPTSAVDAVEAETFAVTQLPAAMAVSDAESNSTVASPAT